MGWFFNRNSKSKNIMTQNVSVKKDDTTLLQEMSDIILVQSQAEHNTKIADENAKGKKQFETIKFGKYNQSNSNVKEDIEWLIINRKNGYIFLLSKYLLDSKKYFENFEPVTWEFSNIRNWLNTEFYNNAFSAIEKERILSSTVDNQPNPKYGTFSGEKTVDKIFLLSFEEAEKYLDYASRQANPTRYFKEKFGNSSSWWLRTAGAREFTAVQVSEDGEIYLGGNGVHNEGYAVRPALWVKL